VHLKSYTLTFTVGSFEKTLTAAEIETVWQSIIEHGRGAGLVLKD
jgi:phenylalanyl-tRNA synthetase beta subunit